MGLVGILTVIALAKVVLAQTCTYPHPCWPSDDAWNALNETLSGSLFRARPPAYVCHVPTINETACDIAKTNWTSEFWRAEQPGGYMDPDSENGDSYCNIDNDPNVPCDQGLVPIYVAKVKNVADIQSAIQFAREHKLSTRVKGASHDFLGRSSGNGTFAISTINLKGIDIEDGFKPQGAPDDVESPGQSVVHVAAGEHWIYVNRAVAAKGRVAVSGYSESVGAAGGWVLGGGHSPLAPQYGLGVDNVLQFEIVTPDGTIRTANQYQEQDLFWALRGGGPGFGVVTKVTYKTHPALNQIVEMRLNFTYTPASYPSFLKTFFGMQSDFLSGNITGYLFPYPTNFFTVTFIPNSGDIAAANATLQPLYDWATQETAAGRPVLSQNNFTVHSSYLDLWHIPPESPTAGLLEGVAVPVTYGSRLLPLNVFENPDTADQLVELLINSPVKTEIPEMPPVQLMLVTGGKVSEVAPDATAANPSWRTSSCHFAFVGAWTTSTSFTERDAIRKNVTDLAQALGRLAPEAGSYVNEGAINEPNWSKTFWGSNYDRLLSIKNTVDPDGIFTCYHCVGYPTE